VNVYSFDYKKPHLFALDRIRVRVVLSEGAFDLDRYADGSRLLGRFERLSVRGFRLWVHGQRVYIHSGAAFYSAEIDHVRRVFRYGRGFAFLDREVDRGGC